MRESEEYVGIKNTHTGHFIKAEEDGKFNARGEHHHSKMHIEHVRDGCVSVKAHNTSWYIGVSMFGHVEPIDREGYDRCHWKVEIAF